MLETDSSFPSVARLIAGEPVRGSWWTHSRAHDIFNTLTRLADHKDVLFCRLVSRKVTLVHRKLWPEVFSAATAGEHWQTAQLTTAGRYLLSLIETDRQLRSDSLVWPKRLGQVKTGDVVRELERSLLIHTEELHTETGAHAKLLGSWKSWAGRSGLKNRNVPVAEAKKTLAATLMKLNVEFGSRAKLPWGF